MLFRSQPFLKGHQMVTQKVTTNADIIHSQGVYIGNNHFIQEEDMDFLSDVIEGIK